MSVSCECCVLSGRGLCDELVPRPEESYRVWCVSSVIVKHRNTRLPRPPRDCRVIGKNCLIISLHFLFSAHYKEVIPHAAPC
jgi:hypothetical protein